MSAGDFVVFPRADLHVIRDAPSTRPLGLIELLSTSPPAANGELVAGGDGPVARLVCGGLRFESFEANPLLAALPPVIFVKGRGDGGGEWLRLTVQHVFDELDSGRAGMDVVIGRLADILFIGAVRNHVEESLESAQTGWFAAVRDQKIGPAIALLHSQPSRQWTVEALADGVALSRSAFASRFTHLVGEPPLRYLTRVRLDNAARRLSRSNEKLSVIAGSAGYDSAAAFTRAFQRHLGMTPGEYRRAHLGR
jgi:AraC-like DNA-binding protein